MLDNKYTEKQYAIQFFDFAVEKNQLKHGSLYLIECRKEIINLINDQISTANFWHDRYIDLAREVMSAANLPSDFKEHGLQEAFKILNNK